MDANIAENDIDIDKPLAQELKSIAQGEAHYISSLRVAEIAFTAIPSLKSINMVHNLVELTLLHTSLNTLQGLESAGHSLNRLTVLSGCTYEPQCQLQSIEPVFLKLMELRYINLGENQITKIENLQNCKKLEKLFLYHNSIKKIENLGTCLSL